MVERKRKNRRNTEQTEIGQKRKIKSFIEWKNAEQKMQVERKQKETDRNLSRTKKSAKEIIAFYFCKKHFQQEVSKNSLKFCRATMFQSV